jgi:hypothetical protein
MSDLAIDSRVNPPRFAYHYTGAAEARAILREGVIRASPCTLYRDLGMTAIARVTDPVVWLTINHHMEMTVLVKVALADGRPDYRGYLGSMPPGRIFRVAVPYGIDGDLSIPEYSDRFGIPYEEWRWNVHTAGLVGVDWTTARLVTRDIPRANWLAVERFAGLTEEGFRWEPIP